VSKDKHLGLNSPQSGENFPDGKEPNTSEKHPGKGSRTTDKKRKPRTSSTPPETATTPSESKPLTALEALWAARDKVHAMANSGALPPVPVWLSVHGGPGIIENSSTVIQGQTGHGKSTWAETFCAALLSDGKEDVLPNLERASERNFFVLYLDTERSDKQRAKALQRIREASGRARMEDRGDLDLVPFDVSKEDAVPVFEEIVFDMRRRMDETGRGEFGLLVCLDVVTDLMRDGLTDVAQVSAFMDAANGLKKLPRTSLCFVIHENPGPNNKARGHAGTELTNKADQVFQAVKDRDVFELRNLKNREAQCRKPLKAIKNNETQCFEPLSGDGKTRLQEERERALDLLTALFTRKESYSRSNVIAELETGGPFKQYKAKSLLQQFTGPDVTYFLDGKAYTLEERSKAGEPWRDGIAKHYFRIGAEGSSETMETPF
jgi:hypothetical protein